MISFKFNNNRDMKRTCLSILPILMYHNYLNLMFLMIKHIPYYGDFRCSKLGKFNVSKLEHDLSIPSIFWFFDIFTLLKFIFFREIQV